MCVCGGSPPRHVLCSLALSARPPPATLAEALRSRPTTYNTVGFMCLYCADDGIGIQNDQ